MKYLANAGGPGNTGDVHWKSRFWDFVGLSDLAYGGEFDDFSWEFKMDVSWILPSGYLT